MTRPTVEELRAQLAAARAEVERLVAALEQAEWVAEYEQTPTSK